MKWLPDIQEFFPWTCMAKKKRLLREKLLTIVHSLKNKPTFDEEFIHQLSEILDCPVAFIAPYTTFISNAPNDAANFATLSKESLRSIDTFILRQQLSQTNPQLERIFTERRIGAVISLWKPPEHSWAAWLIFGENFSERFSTWRDRRLLKKFISEIKERYIKLIMEPALKLQERSAMIANLKRRTSQLERQKNELLDKSLASSGASQDPTSSDNVLDYHIDRYQRRILDVALRQSQGKVEAASQYLGMSNINLIRLMQRLGLNREAYIPKNQ